MTEQAGPSASDPAMFEQGTGAADSGHRGFFAKSGDARQVWARDTTTGQVRFLEPGGVTDAMRTACAAGRLICPMADCPDPRFVARGGQERRHHFAHRHADTRHISKDVFLREATEMIAQWLRSSAGLDLALEVDGATSDLTITSAKSGKQLHLTLTYDRSYVAGFSEVLSAGRQFLLGHTRGLLLPRQPHKTIHGAWWCASPRLVSMLISYAGYALAINPQEQLVGTIVNATNARRLGIVSPGPTVAENICLVEPFHTCKLTEDGVVAPALERFLSARHVEEQRWRPTRTSHPLTGPPTSASSPGGKPPDALQHEFMRRAAGKTTEERLELLREMFVPRPPEDAPKG